MTFLINPITGIKDEASLEEHIADNFDEVISHTGLNLLLVGRQPAMLGNRPDLLALDQDERPWIIELKLGVATPPIVAQALRYANAVSEATQEELFAFSRPTLSNDSISQRFNSRFGRELTYTQGSTPGVLLIAKEFNTEARQAIAGLRRYGVPVAACNYTFEHGTVGLIELDEKEPYLGEKQVLSLSPVPAVSHIANAASPESISAYRVYVHDDVRRFWRWFTKVYSKPVAPIAHILEQYASWRTRTTSLTPRDAPSNLGILSRQIKVLATRNQRWVRVFYKQDCTTAKAADENIALHVRMDRGYPYTKAAYVRQECLGTQVIVDG